MLNNDLFSQNKADSRRKTLLIRISYSGHVCGVNSWKVITTEYLWQGKSSDDGSYQDKFVK